MLLNGLGIVSPSMNETALNCKLWNWREWQTANLNGRRKYTLKRAKLEKPTDKTNKKLNSE
jgi:hypothetical protein